ncbi:MAG: NHLP family bacteriocin export ABC transporter peptidase/permease/ATPase subunit, partial [Bacteroidota bacterium]
MRVKCPTVLQMEAVECGAASLAMLLGHYGRFVPLVELRTACGVSRDGSKASNLLKAARTFGMTAKGYRYELDELDQVRLPFIVFWNFNHFLVVEGFEKDKKDKKGKGGKFFLNDPAMGPRTVSREEFDRSFSGVVLAIEPGPDFAPGGEKPTLWPAVLRRLRAQRSAIAYCFLAGLLLVVPALALPVFTQIFVDQILVQGLKDWLRPLLLSLFLFILLSAALKTVELAALRRLQTKLCVTMGERFMHHVLRLPIGFYAQRFAGEIGNRATYNETIAEALAGPLSRSLVDLALTATFALVMVAFDPVLAAIAILLASLNFLVLQAVTRATKDTSLRLNQEYGKAAGVSIAGLQSIETLKASGLEGDFFARWAGYYAKAMTSQQAIGSKQQWLGAFPPFVQALTAMAILVIGGWRVMDGVLSVGMLVAFQSLMNNFTAPVGRLLAFGQSLPDLAANLTRLDDVLNHPVDPQTEQEPLPREEDPVRLSGALEIRNLTFGYSPLEAPLIENLDLALTPGQRVALVGASGSGKSTLAKLVAGLYEPWSGDIRFDGRLRSEIPRAVLQQSIAMVDQDLFLFSGTVQDNLSLWDPTLTEEAMTRACLDAEIHDTLVSLPGAYQSELLEGAANLSGGQRQRLEIARALSRNPSLLILDEATSALDSASEALVDRNLRRRGCTCLIVAHR